MVSSFSVFILERERVWRQRIRRLLALEPGCVLLGEYAEGPVAAASLARSRPDILFAGADFRNAFSQPAPLIIFTVRAGEPAPGTFNLVKPFNARSFRELLERAKARL